MVIELTVEDRIARVVINTPPLNILTAALQNELRGVFEGLRKRDDHNAVFLCSGLEGKFSGGADVAEHLGYEKCKCMLRSAHALIAEVLRCPVPTLCYVDGPCLGGAFELALACDQLIATSDALFGTPEIKLGCYPPAALVLMPQKLPSHLTAELIQSGSTLSARDLALRGAGVRVVMDLKQHSELTAEEYSNLPRGPLIEASRLLRAGGAERFLSQVGGIEAAYMDRLLNLHDATEGPEAFLAKRKPVWTHR